MKKCDACSIIDARAPFELSEIGKQRRLRFMKEVHLDIRSKKKWILTSVPCKENCKNESEYKEMFNTYLKSSSINYYNFSQAMDNLVLRLEQTKKVRIIAKGTDISFSIYKMPAIKCIGKRNLPDGEVYTAPIKDSINGHITYNLPSYNNGITHNNIYFEFKDGKIINESSDHSEELTKILNIDEGARYIGEFSLGLNPFITKCYNNTLFDEKISGTIHLTPGDAYERCNNGNKSNIHWDIVQSHTPEFGGGEIWFDNELIRKDGLFVVEDLKCLNPNILIKEILYNNEDNIKL